MQGFTLPLFIILAAEGVVAALLMAPRPLCQPGIHLAQWSYSPTGSTITYTVAAVLGVLLASPGAELRPARATLGSEAVPWEQQ